MTRLDRRALFASGAAAALLAATGLSSDRPSVGGRLRLAVARDGSLDEVARNAIHDSLTEIGPDGALRPELATAWSSDSAGRDWRFTIRKDVKFHDDSALTASDVVAVLGARSYHAEAIAEDVVRVTLSKGDPDLPYRLAQSDLVIAKGDLGTGAYRASRYQPGRSFLGDRVVDHYKSGHAGWVDTVEAIVIPDPNVRAEALRDGFVDVAALPAPEGLIGRGTFRYLPSQSEMALAVRSDVGVPRTLGRRAALDDGRIAERWWMA